MYKTTLCYIESRDMYLMLNRNKKDKDLNFGKWIGVGGKFQENETPDQCLIREVKEETGFLLDNYHFHGVIHFISEEDKEDMYLYTAFVSEPVIPSQCDEGTFAWIQKEHIFELPLWEGDKLFLKKLLDGIPSFEMTLEYKEGKLIRATERDS